MASSTPPSIPPSESPPTTSLSDIFSDSPPASPSAILQHPAGPSDIPRLRSIHVTNGYREGIASSKDQALQPGFDEAYPLGAILGLRIGYILGTLEGLCGAYRSGGSRTEEKDGTGGKKRVVNEEQGRGLRDLLAQAREELKVELVFGKAFWGSDGLWAYDVRKKDGQRSAVEEEGGDVTFWEVVDQHPAVRKWLERVRDEVRKVGLQGAEEGFAGIGSSERDAKLENLEEGLQVAVAEGKI
ncbi:MAG: hypothetical protein Q9201_003543 [Fulgogasparrea decipioides]